MENKKNTYSQKQFVRIEKSWFKKMFIKTWYNDLFRFFMIMGLPVVPTYFIALTILEFTGVSIFSQSFVISYILGITMLMIFNDYENLHRIGLSVNKKLLPQETVNNQTYYVITHNKWRYENQPEQIAFFS